MAQGRTSRPDLLHGLCHCYSRRKYLFSRDDYKNHQPNFVKLYERREKRCAYKVRAVGAASTVLKRDRAMVTAEEKLLVHIASRWNFCESFQIGSKVLIHKGIVRQVKAIHVDMDFRGKYLPDFGGGGVACVGEFED